MKKDKLIEKLKLGGMKEVKVPQSAIDYVRGRANEIKIVRVDYVRSRTAKTKQK